MIMRKNIFIFTCLSMLFIGTQVQDIFAQTEGNDLQKRRLTVYGQTFTVTPDVYDGHLSFEDIKSYVPIVMPDASNKNYSLLEILDKLEFTEYSYGELYDLSLETILEKAEKVFPDRSKEDLKAELDQAFKSGHWKLLADKYEPLDNSLPPQMLDTQKLFNSLLAVSYTRKFIANSDEIENLPEAHGEYHGDEDDDVYHHHGHDHD